jgi:hypothetical protein
VVGCASPVVLSLFISFSIYLSTQATTIPYGDGNRYRYRKDDGGNSDAKWGSRGASSTFSFILSISFLSCVLY